MSATGRGAVRSKDDFYATPAWATEAILTKLDVRGRVVLDPCAGDGAIMRVVQAAGGHEIGQGLDAARAALAGAWPRDSLSASRWLRSEMVITNPPFSLAMEFIERARQESPLVAMLLRLSFVEGQKRRAWHRANPSDIYVLSRRTSFTGKGTDACAYAWFVWGDGPGGEWDVL